MGSFKDMKGNGMGKGGWYGKAGGGPLTWGKHMGGGQEKLGDVVFFWVV